MAAALMAMSLVLRCRRTNIAELGIKRMELLTDAPRACRPLGYGPEVSAFDPI